MRLFAGDDADAEFRQCLRGSRVDVGIEEYHVGMQGEHTLRRRVIDFLRDALGDIDDVGAVRVVRHVVDADEALRREHPEHNVVQP